MRHHDNSVFVGHCEAARSAPLMRGLKLIGLPDISRVGFCKRRAVCPANEGIETDAAATVAFVTAIRRAVCPANEGIETCFACELICAAVILPRGLPR